MGNAFNPKRVLARRRGAANGAPLRKLRNDASVRFGLSPEGVGSMARMAVLQVTCLDCRFLNKQRRAPRLALHAIDPTRTPIMSVNRP